MPRPLSKRDIDEKIEVMSTEIDERFHYLILDIHERFNKEHQTIEKKLSSNIQHIKKLEKALKLSNLIFSTLFLIAITALIFL